MPHLTGLLRPGGLTPDIATPIREEVERREIRTERQRQTERQERIDIGTEEDRQLKREAQELDIKAANIELLTARQKGRFDDIAEFTSSITPTVEEAQRTGDTSQLEQSLVRRLDNLTTRRQEQIRAGLSEEEAVDVNETLEGLNMIREGRLDEFANIIEETNRVSDFRRSKRASGADTTAAIKNFRQLQDLRSAGNIDAVNDFIDVLKTREKGFVETPEGATGIRRGVAEATEELAAAKAFGRKAGELKAKLKLEPDVVTAIKIAEIVAAEKGEALASLNRKLAQFPNLELVVERLSVLGKTATFTKLDRAKEAVLREAKLPVGQGAVDRAAYIAIISNEILPLLRDTFGAAFTEREGDTLKATLGDPDLSPDERDVVLKAFISTKASQIEVQRRRAGIEEEPTISPVTPVREFTSIEEAEAANLPIGTEITINGRRAVTE